MGIFTGKAQPATVPTDERIPVHTFDDTLLFRTIIISNMIVFDDALDPKVLRTSMEKLIARPGWRKIGARVRRNKDGVLECHIPHEFTAERPGHAFTLLNLDTITADEHPVGALIPKPSPSGLPAVVGNPNDLRDLIEPEGVDLPRHIDDFLYSDRPVVGVHVTAFKDKTLVMLHMLHIAFDGVGMGMVVENWTRVLHGREDEIPALVGVEKDPLTSLGTKPTVPHVLADRVMGLPGTLAWAARNAVDIISQKEVRQMCVPSAFIEKLRVDAIAQLAAEWAADGKTDEKPFLTQGDILSAWWTRISLIGLGLHPKRTVGLQQVLNMRRTLEKDLLPGPFIGNIWAMGYALLTVDEVINQPLAHTALAVRRAIETQRSREQAEAYFAMHRKMPGRMPVLMGGAGMFMVGWSNWDRAGMYRADFSPAAKRKRAEPLFADCVHCHQGDVQYPEGYLLTGKDHRGNWWFSGYRMPGRWEMAEKELERQLTESGMTPKKAEATR